MEAGQAGITQNSCRGETQVSLKPSTEGLEDDIIKFKSWWQRKSSAPPLRRKDESLMLLGKDLQQRSPTPRSAVAGARACSTTGGGEGAANGWACRGQWRTD